MYPIIKRLMDLAGAVFWLLVLWPVMAAIALAVKLGSPGPVFFRQERPGLGGRIFRIWKFRTMTDERGPDGRLLSDGERLTPVGRLIRRWTLDELPQLFNILKGEMSFIGPRPLLVRYLERYTPEQARRHEVRPGITGWAQINGRNAQSWEERFRHDVWYVDHLSLWLDVRIMLLSIGKVLRREGISAEGHETMPEFMGSAEAEPATEPAAARADGNPS